MSAIERHDEMVAGYGAQQAQVAAGRPGDVWTGALAARFRDNPHRPLDPLLQAIADEVRPEDVLVDVGGGAGRLGLPLALRCREVVIVDPSEGMRQQFESISQEAGVANARYVQEDWLESSGIRANVALVAHVTYFVPDISRFVRKLLDAASTRVMVVMNSVPPPNQFADLFQLLHGQPQSPVPGHRELLPVLWEMGILPDVRILPVLPPGGAPLFRSREEAIESLAFAPQLLGADPDRIRKAGSEHFDQLFTGADGGWVRPATASTRALLITWQTGSA